MNESTVGNVQVRSRKKEVWGDKVHEIYGFVEAALAKKLTQQEAEDLAFDVVRAIGFYMGGRQTYLPSMKKLEAHFRNMRMYRDSFDLTTEELSRKYRLSYVRIHQIMREQRKLGKSRRDAVYAHQQTNEESP